VREGEERRGRYVISLLAKKTLNSGGQKPEAASQRLEARGWRLEAGSLRPDAGCPRQDA